MEKKKLILEISVAVVIFIGMFCISIPVGITSLLFSIIGYVLGYSNRHLRNQDKFFNKLIEHKEDILAGKIVNLVVDETADEIKVFVTEAKVTKKKKTASK